MVRFLAAAAMLPAMPISLFSWEVSVSVVTCWLYLVMAATTSCTPRRTGTRRCSSTPAGTATISCEVADNNCVYRNVVHHSAGEFTQVLQDVAGDPTLPRTKSVRCAVCGHGEAVFFQATARGEEGMTLFFVCCNPSCGHRWRE
ncbi:hypothetical protein ACP70R_032299 [Stipagrostis hirtigluma subsp. patula]